MTLELNDNNGCFGCGKDNPIGLKLELCLDNEEFFTEFTPGPEHQGWAGITHGGIIATLVDEAMGKATSMIVEKAVTAEMNVRFRRPAYVGKKLLVYGRVIDQQGRRIYCKASVHDEDGEMLASATATMVRI